VQEALFGTEDEGDDFEVEPENWETLLVFLACQTQWQREFAGMDGTQIWKGLNYPGVEVVMRMHQVSDSPSVFRDLQIMESSALSELNKQRKPR